MKASNERGLPPNRRSMKILDFLSCLYSTNSVFFLCQAHHVSAHNQMVQTSPHHITSPCWIKCHQRVAVSGATSGAPPKPTLHQEINLHTARSRQQWASLRAATRLLTFSTASLLDWPSFFCCPLAFLPKMSNFLRLNMRSKRFGFSSLVEDCLRALMRAPFLPFLPIRQVLAADAMAHGGIACDTCFTSF